MVKLIERLEINEDISKNSLDKIIRSGRKIRITVNGKTFKVIHRETDDYINLVESKDDKDRLRYFISLLKTKARVNLK